MQVPLSRPTSSIAAMDPNIVALLQLLGTLPISTAEAELCS